MSATKTTSKQTAVDRLRTRIDLGRQGRNIGLSTRCSKLDAITYGVQKATMTVIAGSSGSGKTSYALKQYVYEPLRQLVDTDDIKMIYFSLELSEEVLYAKLMALYIFDEFGVELSFRDILSLRKSLSDEMHRFVLAAYSWLAIVEKHMIVFDKAARPNDILKLIDSQMKSQGEVQVIDGREFYIPYNPDKYTIVIVDHVSLISNSQGKKLKESIDDLANGLVYLRNKYGITVVAVQQLNRTHQSMDRKKTNGGAYQNLQLNDLADSSGTTNAAEIVIGLHNPFREKQPEAFGYDITKIGPYCRFVQILKHRFGESDKSVGVGFFGSIGWFKELPSVKKMSANPELYNEVTTVDFFNTKRKEVLVSVKKDTTKFEIKA